MPQVIPLPRIGKINENFQVLTGFGMLLNLCFYIPEEHSTQSVAASCRESIGIFVWAPLAALIAIIIGYIIWATFFIRCPKCTGRIRSGNLSDRRTLLYPCTRCDILWDSELVVRENTSSGG
jgi:hypothetical protein